MATKAIVFDLDDTLLDWWTACATAARAVAPAHLAHAFEEAIRAEAWARRGGVVVNRQHWRVLADPEPFWREAVGDATQPLEHLVASFREALASILFEDVLETLESLASKRLALLTNNPRGEEELTQHGIRHAFEVVIALEDRIRKPHPEAFRLVRRTLDVPPETIVYVGDSSEADIEGALAAGMYSVWLDRWRDGWHLPPTASRIESLRELPSLVAHVDALGTG